MRPNRREQGLKKVRRVLRIWRAHRDYQDTELYQGLEHRMSATRVPCSCPHCGNPRRHFGEKTRQERRADEAMAAQLEGLA